MPLYLFVLAPIIAGLIAYLLKDTWMSVFIIIFQTFFVYQTIGLFIDVKEYGYMLWNAVGYQDGLALSLYVDTLSAFLVLITSIFFFFFIIFASREKYFTSQFIFMYQILQGLMCGLFMSSDLFNIFIFLEVATVVVAILIMINKEKQAVYDGMIYFFVNVIGTSFLLLGIGILYHTFGLLDIRYLEEAMVLLENPRSMILPFSLMMVTVSLKTAVTPLFSWLPRAHGTPSAPPVVSAVLSGVYIKTGIYLFIRFTQMYRPIINMDQFFFIIGFITAVVGFTMALGQHDIKLILAYHTISQVGLIMMGITMGEEIALWGGIIHILYHALFKSTLFLTAGNIYDVYGTRDIYEIRGVFKRLPITGIAMSFAILGIMGAPFFNASVSKYMIAHGTTDPVITLMLNLVNLGTVMSFVKYSTMLFGKPSTEPTVSGKISWPAQLSSLVLGIGSLITGLYSVTLMEVLFDYELHISTSEYFMKNVVFILMVFAAIAFYKGFIRHSIVLQKIGHIELTFNAIITAMVGYFMVIASVLALFFI